MTGDAPLIRIGADVEGREGSLGEVTRVIVDPERDQIAAVVVKRGRLLATERVVPLASVIAGDGAQLRLDMDTEEFEQLDAFDSQMYREPDPDYTGPPGFDHGGMSGGNMQLNSYVALGPWLAFGNAAPVAGFPGGEVTRPKTYPGDIAEGAGVFDSSGDNVGSVDSITFDAETRRVTSLVMKRGLIVRSTVEVPAEWVQDLEEGAVRLNVDGEQVKQLFDAS
jgi:uncharacterized protein YrrD